jgi:hypothetical protein
LIWSADERPCARACTIATHAPKKATYAARHSVANVIRSDLLLCIAVSFEPISKFRLSWVQVVSCPPPTQRSSKISKAKLPFKDKTGAPHNLFPVGLLNMFKKTLSGMTR